MSDKSYWVPSEAQRRRFPKLTQSHSTEVLVIGGGITGLSTALELLDRGFDVTICEANLVGYGTSSSNSGHLDAHPEQGPRKLLEHVGRDASRDLTKVRQQAIDHIRERAGGDCDFRSVSGFSYTETSSAIDDLKDELDAATEIGLDAAWSNTIPIPRAAGGYRIEGMARFHCWKYLQRLADSVTEAGGKIFEESMVSHGEGHDSNALLVGDSSVKFDHVVWAVHCNGTHSQRLHIQSVPMQSYLIAARISEKLTDGLFWDDSSPYHYVRRLSPDGQTILVGGADHRTGEGESCDAISQLEDWMRSRFHVLDIEKRWSAEFFESTDGLPFIGQVAGKENVWVATGLSGIGLTLGTAAGSLVAAMINNETVPLREVLSPTRTDLKSMANAVIEQTPIVGDYLERILPQSEVRTDSIKNGEGCVGQINGKSIAVCRLRNGDLHGVNPICTHMGGVVRWNEFEQRWDCPVHGGRFEPDGTRTYGPPESDLDGIAVDRAR